VEPEAVHLAYCDDEVHGEVITFDDVNEIEAVAQQAGGGGGTNLPASFEKFREMDLPIEHRIIFTDGYTPFGEDDGIPTVWCITTGVEAPWGVTVHVKIKPAPDMAEAA
jgi:predicted metal-dependent peptidase